MVLRIGSNPFDQRGPSLQRSDVGLRGLTLSNVDPGLIACGMPPKAFRCPSFQGPYDSRVDESWVPMSATVFFELVGTSSFSNSLSLSLAFWV